MADKFKNERKNKDRTQPEVKRRRTAIALETKEPSDAKKKKMTGAWGLPNFLPEKKVEEDETSLKHHIKYIQDQNKLKPSKRDHDKILSRMEATFPSRRERIVNGATVAEIRELYPLLFDDKEVKFNNCVLEMF